MTIKEMFDAMRARVAANPDKVSNLKAAYQFEVTGDGGGVYHATFDNGAYDIGEGALENPGCTVTVSAADFMAMTTGKANPTALFMTGKLKIKGDMGLAMKLQGLLG